MHNLILIALSAGMAGSAVYWAVQGRYNFWGNAFKPSETEMALTIYIFFMSKFYEFFDTVRRLKCVWDYRVSSSGYIDPFKRTFTRHSHEQATS